MSHGGESPVRDEGVDRHARRRRLPVPGRVPQWRRWTALAAAVLALAPVVATVALNAPGTAPVDLAAAEHWLLALGILGPGLAALVLAATERDPLPGLGLLFVGVFGLLSGVAPTALIPAAVAMPAGAALVVLADSLHLRRRRDVGTGRRRTVRPGRRGNAERRPPAARLVVVAVLLGAVLASLAGALGVAAGTLRPVGSALAMLGVGATPVFLPTRTRDWGVGGAVAAGVLTAAAAAPFVLGAVLLVGLGVVGTPLVLVAAGLGGLAVTGAAAARRRSATALAGVGLLLAAGAPATAGGGLAACLGVVLLARADPSPGHGTRATGGATA